MSFADNLRELLDYKNIELKELAAGTGISKNTLDNYLSGQKSLPNVSNGVKIAKFLGVSVEFLVEGKDDSFQTKNSLNSVVENLKKLSKNDYFFVTNIISSLAQKTKFKAQKMSEKSF